MKTDFYRHHFAHLRTDTSPARWSADTRYRAPHKPFLLLAVLDLIAQGVIRTNFIELNAGLMDTFDLYWVKVMGREKDGNPVLPFYHLQSDGFWHLAPVPGMEKALVATQQIRSIGPLHQLVLGAKLEDELFNMLLNERERDYLRQVLIETYFALEVRPKLAEVGKITADSFQYSQELRNRSQEPFMLKEESEAGAKYNAESRSTAFRRVVVEAYNHTCAVCGIHVVTPEGRTAVAAAHIVPWSVSHNDDPRNGMALCGLHHWTFDQGLIGVGLDYKVVLSPVLPADQGAAGPLLTLKERELHRPTDRLLWPAKEALRWHQKKVFRSELPLRLF